MNKYFHCSANSPAIGTFSFLFLSHANGYVVVSHCHFNLQLPNHIWWASCHLLIFYLYSFLDDVSIHVFTSFYLGSLFSYYWIFRVLCMYWIMSFNRHVTSYDFPKFLEYSFPYFLAFFCLCISVLEISIDIFSSPLVIFWSCPIYWSYYRHSYFLLQSILFLAYHFDSFLVLISFVTLLICSQFVSTFLLEPLAYET